MGERVGNGLKIHGRARLHGRGSTGEAPREGEAPAEPLCRKLGRSLALPLRLYSNPFLDRLHVAKAERYWTIRNRVLGSRRFYQGTSEALDSKAAGLAPLPFVLRSI